MPDHDPGNAGGSIIIPPSPIKPTGNWYKCETCGARFKTENDLEQHTRGHVVPYPVLFSGNTEVASPCTLTNTRAVSALWACDSSRVEIGGRSYRPDTLQEALLKMNGRPECDVTLVGEQEHFRNVYRLRVAIFDHRRLSHIDTAFFAQLNGVKEVIPVIPDFLQPWNGMPERAYAEALAAFRLAMFMRDDPAGSDSHAALATVEIWLTYGKLCNRCRASWRGPFWRSAG